MNAPIPQFPTRPNEVPDEATVTELFDAYSWHLALAVGGRSTEAAPDGLHARHAVAAIAQAVIDTFADERWPLVRDALTRGATAETVGGALGGLEVAEIAAGLRSWVDRENQAGRLSLDDYDAVVALAAGGAR
jgi:hypothetical protein